MVQTFVDAAAVKEQDFRSAGDIGFLIQIDPECMQIICPVFPVIVDQFLKARREQHGCGKASGTLVKHIGQRIFFEIKQSLSGRMTVCLRSGIAGLRQISGQLFYSGKGIADPGGIFHFFQKRAEVIGQFLADFRAFHVDPQNAHNTAVVQRGAGPMDHEQIEHLKHIGRRIAAQGILLSQLETHPFFIGLQLKKAGSVFRDRETFQNMTQHSAVSRFRWDPVFQIIAVCFLKIMKKYIADLQGAFADLVFRNVYGDTAGELAEGIQIAAVVGIGGSAEPGNIRGGHFPFQVTEFQVMAWTLPTEAGFYYMRDLMHTSPLEVGLERGIDWDKDFIGKEALLKEKEAGPAREMLGFTVEQADIQINGKHMGGPGDPVLLDGEEVGRVSKIVYGYVKDTNIGYILARKGALKPGDKVMIHGYEGQITEKCFM